MHPLYGDYLNTLCLAVKIGPKNVTDIPLSINTGLKNVGLSILVAVMAHDTPVFDQGALQKSVVANTASVPIVLRSDIPTQLERSFSSERFEFWVKNTVI
jgi:hypothetical protein